VKPQTADSLDVRRRRLVLAAMCLALATVVSAVSSLNVALPDIARDLGATQTQLQWIVDSYAVVFAGLLLLAGALGDPPRVPALVDRFGPARIGPLGLLLMAAGFAVFSTADVDSGYWLLLAGVVLLGAGAALATTPATTAIVSSLPRSKQGVASAVNDLAREVGGALGIAVLGSALTDRYQAGIADALAGTPTDLAHRAQDALPAALALAERLGPNGADLAARAQAAFVDGLGLAMLIAAASVAAVAVFVFWRAPREAVAQSRDERAAADATGHPAARVREQSI
jgi:MFS family permease